MVTITPIGSPVHFGPYKHTLVLDIDETLVHCGHDKIDNPDLFFEVKLEGQIFPIYCLFRPHLFEFLATVSSLFHVVAFTASLKDYADKLLDFIDPERIFFKERYFRDSCGINFCKDLLAVQQDMQTICIIDNLPQAYDLQPANGIDIVSWYSDNNDTALLDLIPFLISLTHFADVRPPIRQRSIQKLMKRLSPDNSNNSSPSLKPTSTAAGYYNLSSCKLITSARQNENVACDIELDGENDNSDENINMDNADSLDDETLKAF